MTYTKMANINREHRVLGMIAQGMPYDRIANVTGIQRKTINQMALRNGIRRGEPRSSQEAQTA